MFTRTSVLAATVCALTLALTGCGDDSAPDTASDVQPSASASPSPTEAPEGRLLTAAEAKAALPAVTDLPGSGWRVEPDSPDEPDATVEPASCAPAFVQVGTTYSGYKTKVAGSEKVTFANDADGFTEVLFDVTSWTNAADSALPIEAGATVEQCPSFTVTDGGTTLPVTAKKLTPLAIGEKQGAVQFASEVNGTPVYITVSQVVVGHNLISVAHTSLSPEDPQKTYEPVVQSILADLQKA